MPNEENQQQAAYFKIFVLKKNVEITYEYSEENRMTEEPEGINNQIYSTLSENRILIRRFDIENLDQSEEDKIWRFLNSKSFDERKDHSFVIISDTLEHHGKRSAFYHVLKKIINIEEGTQKFYPNLRDHVSHSIYVYLLGLFFISNICTVDDYAYFKFRWKLASILHDLGNPPHLFSLSILDYLNSIQNTNTSSERIRVSLSIENIETLVQRPNRPDNSIDYLEQRLSSWNIPIDLRGIYTNNLNEGKIEHGILGALLSLKILDKLYCDNNPDHYRTDTDVASAYGSSRLGWGRNHFDKEIVDACSAISIHNIMGELDNVNITYESARLAYLLILCDSIQEWDRFSPGQRIYDAFSIRPTFRNGIPNIHFSLPNYKIENMNQVLSKLSRNDRRINVQSSYHRPGQLLKRSNVDDI